MQATAARQARGLQVRSQQAHAICSPAAAAAGVAAPQPWHSLVPTTRRGRCRHRSRTLGRQWCRSSPGGSTNKRGVTWGLHKVRESELRARDAPPPSTPQHRACGTRGIPLFLPTHLESALHRPGQVSAGVACAGQCEQRHRSDGGTWFFCSSLASPLRDSAAAPPCSSGCVHASGSLGHAQPCLAVRAHLPRGPQTPNRGWASAPGPGPPPPPAPSSW